MKRKASKHLCHTASVHRLRYVPRAQAWWKATPHTEGASGGIAAVQLRGCAFPQFSTAERSLHRHDLAPSARRSVTGGHAPTRRFAVAHLPEHMMSSGRWLAWACAICTLS